MPRFAAPLFALLLCACGDSDEDGLSAGEESDFGTSPNNADSDGDGLNDGAERDAGTDPMMADTDGDGLGDGVEEAFGSDPRKADSDSDGLSDLTELRLGANPNAKDSDSDGLDDNAEVNRGTDPGFSDSDSDGMNDGDEVAAGTDPNARDSDADGLLDGAERELGTNPLLADTDTDGFSDSVERFSGSVATDRNSWPYHDGVWPDRSSIAASKVAPTGWQVGGVPTSTALIDQYSRFFDLHQFYGYLIRLDVLWDGDPLSESIASGARIEWEDHRADGYVILHALFKRPSVPEPIAEVVPAWARQYALEFPVAAGGEAGLNDTLAAAGISNGDEPVTLLIDRKMVIRGAWVNGDYTGFSDLLNSLL
jgi:hypothetical protein